MTDGRRTVAEFARVRRPGGFLAFSTHRPVDDFVAFDAENYVGVETQRMTWPTADGEVGAGGTT